MKVRLTPAAEADVADILSWYRERGHDLPEKFLASLGVCLDAVARTPSAFARVHDDIRRALLRRFPYCVFYIISGQEVVVLACFHGHRDPASWKSRRDA
ncbi:MAG: type II toxin-antitoxin system RelE/ParE family toxin [Candidatus Polarisedimenticolia bacterium]